MAEAEKQAAAYEDTKADTRSAAKWLIAAFAGVGAALLSGVGLSDMGALDGARLALAIAAFLVGGLGVVIAISAITDILTPVPVTIAQLADFERRRNEKAKRGRNDALIAYIESDPSFLQGIVDRKAADDGTLLITANQQYRDAVDERFRSAEHYWKLVKAKGTADRDTQVAKTEAEVANNRVETMHETVRRLEQIATGQQTVFSFNRRRPGLAIIATFVALSMGAFAFASNPPDPATADLRGANLKQVDLSGASLREANLSGMTLDEVDFEGTNLEGADIDKTVWKDTTCPDGTNSDNAGETCEGHLDPVYRPRPLQ